MLSLLVDGEVQRDDPRVFRLHYSAADSPAHREAFDVLAILGGVRRPDSAFVFDYPPFAVIREVAASGMLPDQRAHQYYPTPRALAEHVVAAAEIEPHHAVPEPSAGQGAIADLLPIWATLVEAAPLPCEILRAKGREPICTDFLRWIPGRRFDRVVMNPPFDRGQWQAHLEHAAELVAAGGRIVAVLLAGTRSRGVLPGWSCTWNEPEPFPGTSIEVVVLVAGGPSDGREEGVLSSSGKRAQRARGKHVRAGLSLRLRPAAKVPLANRRAA